MRMHVRRGEAVEIIDHSDETYRGHMYEYKVVKHDAPSPMPTKGDGTPTPVSKSGNIETQ